MAEWPTKKIKTVTHVGSLNAADKRKGSYEGAGLSVSLHPEEWRQIARGLVCGETWTGQRGDGKSGRFADIHRLTRRQKDEVSAWGLANGLAVRRTLYGFSYEDDELERTVSFVFDDVAKRDYEADDNDDATLFEEEGLVATDALRAISSNDCQPGIVEDMVLFAYVDTQTDLDGCWWTDVLDVLAYSAPRGVIVPSKIPQWTFSR